MKLVDSLRTWLLYRRIALACERLADSNETLARLAQADYDERHPKRGGPRKVVIGQMDVAATNAQWHADRYALGLEDEAGNPL